MPEINSKSASHQIERVQWEPYEKLSTSPGSAASALSVGMFETMKHDYEAAKHEVGRAVTGIETSFKDVFTPGIKSTTGEQVVVAGVLGAVAVGTFFGFGELAAYEAAESAGLAGLGKSAELAMGLKYEGGLPILEKGAHLAFGLTQSAAEEGTSLLRNLPKSWP